MTLVDTSVWIRHLRKGDERLVRLLEQGSVLCHPFVIGEMACGRLRNRDELLSLLRALPSTPVSDDEELLDFITRRKLAGRGLGWIDMHLLAAALLAHCGLWTLDKALARAAAGIVSVEC